MKHYKPSMRDKTMTPLNRIQPDNLVLVLLAVLLFSSSSFAAEALQQKTDQQAATQQLPLAPLEIKTAASTFQYHIEGRPDPFKPFVSERSTRNEDPNEIVDEDKVLTGMQLFEPSQLTLVALMATANDRFAMVQDFTGKGYIIKEGMKIGRRGVVAKILPARVIIEEKAKTRGGQILTNEIAMVLKKEGEE